jgi:hypothetical protein
LSGAVGQQEKTERGLSRSASGVPRTASCRSRITSKPPALKAPVTTGFSPRRRERKSRNESWISSGTSAGMRAVDWAAMWGREATTFA